jgi:hypothetical protein
MGESRQQGAEENADPKTVHGQGCRRWVTIQGGRIIGTQAW